MEQKGQQGCTPPNLKDLVSRITVIPYDPNLVIDPLSDDFTKQGGQIIFDRESRNVLALGKHDE